MGWCLWVHRSQTRICARGSWTNLLLNLNGCCDNCEPQVWVPIVSALTSVLISSVQGPSGACMNRWMDVSNILCMCLSFRLWIALYHKWLWKWSQSRVNKMLQIIVGHQLLFLSEVFNFCAGGRRESNATLPATWDTEMMTCCSLTL